MSVELTAFLERRSVPDRDQLQAAIDSLECHLEIDRSFTRLQSQGFLPCTLSGEKSGFEIYFEPAAEHRNLHPRLRHLLGFRPDAIPLRWGADMRECACACVVAAALAKDFGAVVYYPADDIVYSAAQLLQEAGGALGQPIEG